MSDFVKISKSVNAAFKSMIAKDKDQKNMFIVDVTGDELWDHYLASFPEGSNPMFRERTEHDCSTCRNFAKNIGGVVFVKGNEFHSVWDIDLNDETYVAVAKSMSEFVKSKAIKSPFYVGEPKYGDFTTGSGGEIWNHFCAEIPRNYVLRNNDSNVIGMRADDVAILRRSIEEISDESIDIVLDLIDQKSLYRGTEFKGSVDSLKKIKSAYAKVKDNKKKEHFLWTNAQPNTRFRNTVIGTLLTDLSEGVDLDRAVASFESKVAPTNYKRPTALVTQKMINEAKKKVEELGIEDSLARRYATKEDISVNNVLFVDGNVKPALLGGAFDKVKPSKNSVPEFKNVDSIAVEDFINNVLPKANEVELFVERKHANHFVSLVAPVYSESAPLFKWDNGFSWSYDGDVTDSIKERVKRAGGKVDGDIRVSLSWHNGDDLDLSIERKPKNSYNDALYFGNKRAYGAFLDVDMNAGYTVNSNDPVENIVWDKRRNAVAGEYSIIVHNYNKRSTSNVGFEIEVEVEGQIYHYEHSKDLLNRQRVEIGQLVIPKSGEIVVKGIKKGNSSVEKWGVNTEQWVPVDMIMRSPNFWDGKTVGNQHVFFMLKDCVNPEGVRGFYNEFLRDDLMPHRKVFELLSGSLKVEYNDNQLSGIGVSTTKKEEILVRVKGSINRVLKVIF